MIAKQVIQTTGAYDYLPKSRIEEEFFLRVLIKKDEVL
jgi:hypothetical protein